MGKSLKRGTAAEEEFAKLTVQLVQTANDTNNCLKRIKRILAKYDNRHGLHFRSSSKHFMSSDIRVVKGTIIDLRYVAKRISRNKSHTKSEINAARISMNAAADAMSDLKQAGRVFDQNNGVSGDAVRKIDNHLGGIKNNDEEGKEGLFVYKDNVSKGEQAKKGSADIKTSDMVESLVQSTLNDEFNGFHALKQQIRATENAMSPSIATLAKNAVVDVATKLIGDCSSPRDNNQSEHTGGLYLKS